MMVLAFASGLFCTADRSYPMPKITAPEDPLEMQPYSLCFITQNNHGIELRFVMKTPSLVSGGHMLWVTVKG